MNSGYLNNEQARQLAMHWARTEPIIRVYLASALGDGGLIDDVVQEVALVVTEKFTQFDPDREFSHWAMGIARNRVCKTVRAKVRDRHVFSNDMINELADVVEEVSPEYEARKNALHKCMSLLQGRPRRITEMRYQWGKQVQQIAEDVGMTRVGVSSLLLRVRKALAQCIKNKLSKESE